MPKLTPHLSLARCPHCNVDTPSLVNQKNFNTNAHDGDNKRTWYIYLCSRCGGLVLAASPGGEGGEVTEIYPETLAVDETIPDPAKSYLQQAIDTLHSPAGSVMLCNSAVDAMLKVRGYKDGSVHNRINQAVEDRVLTEDMGQWAHKVRLDSNEPRHADEVKPLPTTEDARRSVDFVKALAEILFVLPARVRVGIQEGTEEEASDEKDNDTAPEDAE